ncbi:hypothetical protein 2209_scaffold64_00006 [Bacteriophage sp.]|nr:hypothetical protein 2209_scaffold64_00006 [Bacteriophage sp.]
MQSLRTCPLLPAASPAGSACTPSAASPAARTPLWPHIQQ